MSIVFEVCIDSVEAALAAQQGGAQRVELCADLLEGGTTPSGGTIQLARQRIDIDLNVIIRPRGGDFCYSDVEFEVMRRDIQLAKQVGANGVVIGILNEDGTIDEERTAELIRLGATRSRASSCRDCHIISTGIWQDSTRCSATGILPGHASLVTVGCEAPGTRVSLTR